MDYCRRYSCKQSAWKLSALLMAVYIISDVTVNDIVPKLIEQTSTHLRSTTCTCNLERKSTNQETKQLLKINRDPSFDFQKEMKKLNDEKVKQDDPTLISLIRNYYIEPPSHNPYNLTKPQQRDQSCGQAMFIDGILRNKENGFFMESGAHDGEDLSNTLFFERFRQWTGLLIEPQPQFYKKLKMKNRKSYTLNACICANQDWPSTVQFWAVKYAGGIAPSNAHGDDIITVQCFPLYSILLAMNQTNVDYFSLDVEGAEQGILDTVPWALVNITTFSIEYDKFRGTEHALKNYMKQRGYKFMVKMDSNMGNDCIFKKI